MTWWLDEDEQADLRAEAVLRERAKKRLIALEHMNANDPEYDADEHAAIQEMLNARP